MLEGWRRKGSEQQHYQSVANVLSNDVLNDSTNDVNSERLLNFYVN
jgi:hypothetical protein